MASAGASRFSAGALSLFGTLLSASAGRKPPEAGRARSVLPQLGRLHGQQRPRELLRQVQRPPPAWERSAGTWAKLLNSGGEWRAVAAMKATLSPAASPHSPGTWVAEFP